MSTSYAHFSMRTPQGLVESRIVTVTMTKEAYDNLVREASRVDEEMEYTGEQILAGLVLDYIKDDSIPLDPIPSKTVEVEAQPQSDGSYMVTYDKTLQAGDTLVIKGIIPSLSEA